MKKILKIGVLSLALIISLFLLSNTTKASNAVGNVTLKINGTGNTCKYGTSLDLDSGFYSTSTFTLTGTFSWAFSGFYCQDNSGVAGSRTMSMQSTSALTGTYLQTIPSTNVYMKTQPSVVSNGTCTASPGTTSWATINSAQTVLWKTAAAGQVCTITVTGVMLYVNVPANQAVGAYTGELTLSVPF